MELEGVPELWLTFCRGLQASDELATKLWGHVQNRDQVKWQLNVLRTRAGSLRGATVRTQRFAKVLKPATLMAACVALEPEGRPRSREIRRFESNILRLTHQGEWRW
jgi:hypothetical protein